VKDNRLHVIIYSNKLSAQRTCFICGTLVSGLNGEMLRCAESWDTYHSNNDRCVLTLEKNEISFLEEVSAT
jgi:hypothetical protein